MSYRDDKQSLEPSLTKILEGVNEFDGAVRERVESCEWKGSHIAELNQIRTKLLILQIDMERIKSENW